ncbi:hypothetical protein Ddye_000763 [Dipteronia dyeriana]|uniref:Uncharacterized protein n=1 Tax=Dipteronia dyeriana TaxID=168575 RepID=A0AAD9XMB9_9ROSI|nr:hypothetical protein Ddye_000763 [Dipteronia dyeriana]
MAQTRALIWVADRFSGDIVFHRRARDPRKADLFSGVVDPRLFADQRIRVDDGMVFVGRRFNDDRVGGRQARDPCKTDLSWIFKIRDFSRTERRGSLFSKADSQFQTPAILYGTSPATV